MDEQNLPPASPLHPPSAPDDVWAAHFSTPAGRRHWPSEELVRSLAGQRFGTAVEAGCGDGANLGLLSSLADHVVAVDACEAARTLAQQRADGLSNVYVMDGDLRAIPAVVAVGTADLLVDVQASQHLPWSDHEQAYRGYRAALKAGGRLVLLHFSDGMTVGAAPPDDLYTYAEIPPYPGVSPACVPPAAALLACVTAAGFQVDDWRQVVRIRRNTTIRYTIVEATAI